MPQRATYALIALFAAGVLASVALAMYGAMKRNHALEQAERCRAAKRAQQAIELRELICSGRAGEQTDRQVTEEQTHERVADERVADERVTEEHTGERVTEEQTDERVADERVADEQVGDG